MIVIAVVATVALAALWASARGAWSENQAPGERWMELRFFRDETRVGLGRDVEVLHRTWLAFRQLRRDGTFEPEEQIAERKLFGRSLLDEDEARRRVLGPPVWRTCTAFTQPSCVSGLCCECGHDQAAHLREERRRSADKRAIATREAIWRTLGMVGGLELQWTASFDDPTRTSGTDRRSDPPAEDAEVWDVRVHAQRITREQWEALRAGGLPILSWDEAAPRWAAADAAEQRDDEDGPESDGPGF